MTTSCAQQGRPSGGPKDSIPPRFINALPANFTTEFKAKIVRINFDEYINLKEPRKQILISPPMETRPIISPVGQPMSYVEIEILDTLKPETTYTINFGRSIVDNNEENPLPFFKYVFSTGDYIDSLQVAGTVTDAFKRETSPFISVMLYKLDSAYSDSIVYKKPPTYIAYTKDSTNTFKLENLEAGDYKIVAIKDHNRNYLFNPGREKIGFLTDTIHLPTDKTFDVTIFREIPEFQIVKVKQISSNHLIFAYEGDADSVEIKLLSNSSDYRASYFKRHDKDTLDYWFTPRKGVDSLQFLVRKKHYQDTLMAVLDDEMTPDSLQLSPNVSSTLPLFGDFELQANTPLTTIDTTLIRVIDTDSIEIPYQLDYNKQLNKLVFEFNQKPEQSYAVEAFPGAITDLYGVQNDTLMYRLQTKAKSKYANLDLTLQNIKSFPVIVQLVDEKGEAKREIIHREADGNRFNFKFLPAGKYYVRVIYDANDNGIWDTGSYLEKRQSEEVIYMRKPLDVRENWEISQTFMLK